MNVNCTDYGKRAICADDVHQLRCAMTPCPSAGLAFASNCEGGEFSVLMLRRKMHVVGLGSKIKRHIFTYQPQEIDARDSAQGLPHPKGF